ncbi:MAG: aldo/keto reductase [Verrucomicrobiota bacterium]
MDSRPSPTSNTGPTWSKLGLGTGTLASLGRAASVSQVEQLIGAMLDLGITVIDTADSYGSGDCEILLGKVLRVRRSSFTLVTKAGYRLSNLGGPLRPLNQFVKKGFQRLGLNQRFEPAYLKKCLDKSLSRLKMDHVDVFLLHDPPLETVTSDGVLHLCRDFVKSGKAHLVGVSSGDPVVLRQAIASGVFEVIQTPANLGAASALRPLWQECEASRIHVIGNHVFSPQCLAIPGMTHEKLMRGSAALLPVNSTILCGSRNPSHLRETNGWAHNPMPEVEAEHLAEILL